ncbi:MAG: 50S ribosomal protein L23 [Bacteroidetes bacterium]|nr:MAG: 50S ribosomal protein L23 [Bacteroidota bacterium]
MMAILVQPLLTEKMTDLAAKRQYAFKVAQNANKIEIARAVEKKFNVTVTSVRTLNVKGKVKTQLTRRGRVVGKRSDWKKAVVTLKDGQTIDFLATA